MRENPSKSRNLDRHESDTTLSEDIESDDSDWKHVRVNTMARLILTAPTAAPRHMWPHKIWIHAVEAHAEIEASMPGTMIPGTSWRQIELRAAMASFEKEKWVEAMNRGYRELTDKGTFETVYFSVDETRGLSKLYIS